MKNKQLWKIGMEMIKNSLIQITRVLKEVEICEIEMLGLSRQTLSDDLIMTAWKGKKKSYSKIFK